jgi:hypothetical protein
MTRPTQPRTRLAVLILAGVFAIVLPPGARAGDEAKPRFDPTDRYEARRVEGWDVLVHKALLAEKPDLAGRTLTLLGHQLYQVARVVPPEALRKLKTIRIWVEDREPHHPCMAYHPDAGWLEGHGMNPEKARCVEIAHAENFLSWTRDQPWMVLHELAHGFHHQFLDGGFDNAEVRDAFDLAAGEKLYEAVLRINGRDDHAYAATNPMEYFAEASEAFFGTNDFYPYVRSELRRHDPRVYELLEKLWGKS